MSQEKTLPEPSMEEILSSIRRIIADEDKEPEPARQVPLSGGETDVLELTTVAEDDPAPIEPPPAATGAAAPAVAATASGAPPPAEPSPTATADASLISASAAAASMSALAKLAKPAATEPAPSPGSGLTVEALVTQLLKPALREWLDKNLPPLVERIVEQEVRKLARRAELS